jgi:hypothetical protein
VRADSGFWSNKVIDACAAHDVRYSITVRATKPVVAAIAAVDEATWVDLDYTDGGAAPVASSATLTPRTRMAGRPPPTASRRR